MVNYAKEETLIQVSIISTCDSANLYMSTPIEDQKYDLGSDPFEIFVYDT